ncbi:MAG: PAS domain S-box protein [Desulfobacterales bacterium]|nr:PAS domain S-box protein [Desulfobacterales bacterium]MDX2512439.1 PAS domain S-box protein [Desulfobacterales bacterium]
MRLRLIILVLSLLAFLSASTGGYFYYDSLKEAAFNEAERQAVTRIALIKKNISSYLSENIKAVKVLAGMDEMLEMLVRPDDIAQNSANAVLDLFKASLETDVCYLMNHEGVTLASSNRNAPDSFVGKNFAFRPYFQQAIHSAPSTYLALGTTSKKRGVYYSFPVFEKGEDIPIGLVVIKGSIDEIEKKISFSEDETVLVTDPLGVIFISSRKDWLFQTIDKLSAVDENQILQSRQFGKGPWFWTGLSFLDNARAEDREGNQYRIHHGEIDNYPGWRFIHLRNRDIVSKLVSDPPFTKIMGPIVLFLCLLIGMSVFVLYRKASGEILQRKSAEKALRKSEERYRNLYHQTPAMLHSIGIDGYLVSVSDYWAEVMGYEKKEVVGKRLTDFFTDASRGHAELNIFPQFFKTGFCKDVPYQFVKKNGEIIDVLLSAISDRKEDGQPVRSLAVSIDVTERKRAEEALNRAKEELSRYSKELEAEVRERTAEISSILKYTPDVVSIKDELGRYRLINTRFETILNKTNEHVRGKTDFEILPAKVAEKIHQHDQQVLSKGRSFQVEEYLPHDDGLHTYLSVKFPVYDEYGVTTGVGAISTNIMEVKKAQDQLRRLSGSIMANQEKERAYIARELHDELGQVLTALRMDAVWFQERMKGADPLVAKRAAAMCKLIDKTIEEVRLMAIRLRPGVLDHLGLVDALEWYSTDFERRTDVSCVFDHSDVPNIDENIAITAYRITQEALTNVLRHAAAKHVFVTLRAKNGALILQVADDGSGFDQKMLQDAEGLGVAFMRERAVLVGGVLDVKASSGNGTTVTFRLPLEK